MLPAPGTFEAPMTGIHCMEQGIVRGHFRGLFRSSSCVQIGRASDDYPVDRGEFACDECLVRDSTRPGREVVGFSSHVRLTILEVNVELDARMEPCKLGEQWRKHELAKHGLDLDAEL